MMYERYELKIQRLATVKKNVMKFKIPFIILLGLLLLAVTVLLSLRGTITTDLESVSDITYGQRLSLHAEVMFGDADFEYRQINKRSSSEWTSEEPILPGTYEVRVTSSRTFGTSKGDSCEFSILPKEANIKVSGSNIVFGNDFTFTSNLESGDYISYGDVIYEEENFYILTSQNVSPDLDSIIVYNKNGVDVSTAYDFTAVSSSITFSPRPITITADSATKTYDKTELTCDTYSVSNLIDSHEVTLNINGTITNFGTSYNTISDVEIFSGDTKITNMYNINAQRGTLSITKKDLFVTTSSNTKVYDGSELSSDTFTYDGLVVGDTINLLTSDSITFFGSQSNKLVVTTNCNENYNIIYTYGTLNITAKSISVTTSSSSNEYNGYDYFDRTFNINGLILGDTTKVTSNSSIKYVGEVSNNLVVAIYNGSKDISDCYIITYTYGKLTVTKKDVIITSSNDSKEYDGSILENKNVTTLNLATTDNVVVIKNTQITLVSTVDNVVEVNIFNNGVNVNYCYNIEYVSNQLEIYSRTIYVQTNDNEKEYDGTALVDSTWIYVNNSTKLVSNHSLSINTTGTITNFGEVSNTYSSYTIYDNGTNVTNNYNVIVTQGVLSITKRNVTITTASASMIYDDTQLINNSFTVTKSSLVLNHTIDVTITGSITDVGSTDNICSTPIVLSGISDVTFNYNITVEYGKLTITSRIINVISNSNEKVYDGEELINHSWDYNNSNYEIVDGHTATVIYSGTQTNAGSSDNTISSFKILKGAQDVTSNYTINIQTEKLTVTIRSISVVTGSDEKEYDGVALTVNTWSYDNTVLELVAGHNLIIEYTGSQLEVGSSDNTWSSFKVLNGISDVTSNYEVSINTGTLTVTKLSVTVKTNSNSYVYNGVVQYDSTYFVDLADNHTSKIDVITGELNFIVNGVNGYTIKIYDVSNNDVTSNYDISYEYGRLDIYKREVTIITNSSTREYDGTKLTNSGWSYDATLYNFVNTHVFNIDINGYIIEVFDELTIGTTSNSYVEDSISIIDATSNDVLSNYELTINLGTLTIEHRVVDITTASGNKVFDDTELSVSGYTLNESSLFDIVVGEILTVNAQASVTYVTEGIITNTYDDYYVMSDNVDVTKNYKFDISLGTIYIEQRTVMITTGSICDVYDGEELYIHEWFYTDGTEYDILTNIHTFDVVYLNSLINFGTIANEITFNIFRTSDNYNLNDNYNIIVENGVIEVYKRIVNIVSADDHKIYDGYELSNSSWYYTPDNEYEFVDDVEVVINSAITNFGQVDNVISDIIVDDGEKNDNYIINTSFGELSISKRDVVVTTSDDYKVYDGFILSNDNITIESNNGDRGIALTDTFFINSTTTIKYVSKVINEVDFILYNDAVSYGDFDPNLNYNISIEYGYLEIFKNEITIQTGTKSDCYNGTFIYSDEYEIILGELAITDELVLIDVTKLWLVSDGVIDNTLVFEIYHIDGNTDLSYNYDISFEKGKLEMFQYEIILETGSGYKVYDGTVLKVQNFIDENGNDVVLLGSDRFKFISSTEVRYNTLGEINNEIQFEIYNNDIDVTSNYNCIYSCGTLEIVARDIVIQTGSKTFAYTGLPHYYESFEYVTELQFIETDGYNITYLNSVTYVTDGYVDNIILVSFLNTEATSSYNIIVVEPFGVLNVTAIDVTVHTQSAEKMYDKLPLTQPAGAYVTGLDELHGYTYILNVIGTITQAGSTLNIIDEDNFVIYDEQGNDVTKNFIINYDYGTLTVYELNLDISSVGGDFEYDGTDLTNGHIIIKKDNVIIYEQSDLVFNQVYSFELSNTDTIYFRVTGFVESTDLYNLTKNTFDCWVYNDTENVTDSYNLSKTENEMQIIKRNITITSGSQEFEFDNEAHMYEHCTITSGSLVLDHHIFDVYTGFIIYPGYEENYFTVQIFDSISNVDNFYNVTLEYGTLIMNGGNINFVTADNADNPFVFDGNQQSLTEFKIVDDNGIDITDEYLSKFTFNVDSNSITTIRNVSQIGTSNEFIIRIFADGVEITTCFIPNYEYGSLYMDAIEIEIAALDGFVSYEYSGYSQTIKASDVYVSQAFDSFIVINGTVLTDPGQTILTFEISFGSFDSNYIKNYSNDEEILEITKKIINISTYDVFYEYNAELQGVYEYNQNGSFVLNHGELFSFDTTFYKDINYVDGKFIGNSNDYLINFSNFALTGVDINKYYDIYFEANGYLAITKISVFIETLSDEKVYDGTELSLQNAIISGNILSGHDISVIITKSITNVGVIENDYDTIKFVDNNGILTSDEVKYLYDIDVIIGELIITARDLEIIAFSYSRPYAQTSNYRIEHVNYTSYIIPVTDPTNSLVSGHELTLDAIELSVNRVGTIELFNFNITDGFEDVTSNYNITSVKKSVTYTQIGVTLTAASASKVYDGEALYDLSATITQGYLIEGHSFEVLITASRTSIGQTTNRILSYTIFDENNNVLTDEQIAIYYDISTVNGLLKVT